MGVIKGNFDGEKSYKVAEGVLPNHELSLLRL